MRSLQLFDHSVPLHSGYSFRSRNLLLRQKERGWQTLQVTSPRHYKDGPNPETVHDLTFHRSQTPSGFQTKLPVLRELAEIRASKAKMLAVANDFKPDVIHAHSPVLNAVAAGQAARKIGVPFVYEIRAFWEDAAVGNGTTAAGSARYHLTKMLESRAVGQADAVTVICDGLRDDLISRGFPQEKLFIIPNAVDLSQFGGQPPRDSALADNLGLDGKIVLGFLGSFYDYEGLDILIEAMTMLPNDIHALLVGGGPRDAALKAQAKALGLSERIHFTGRVDHNEVSRYYSLIDILVFPRKSMRLTELVTPLKPLESMAQLKLVAASSVGGHRELIESGKTGALFEPDNPKALADCVSDLLQHKGDWPQILDNGRSYVENVRNWPNSVANYQAVYQYLGLLD